MAWRTRPTYQTSPQQSEAPPVPIGTLPAGYSVTLPNIAYNARFVPVPLGLSPLLGAMKLGGDGPALGSKARDPRVGAFLRESLPAGTLDRQNGNAPAWAPDGRIGRLTIGRSPIGRRPEHRVVTVPGGGQGETEQ